MVCVRLPEQCENAGAAASPVALVGMGLLQLPAKVRASHTAVEGNVLGAVKKDVWEYAGWVAFQDK